MTGNRRLYYQMLEQVTAENAAIAGNRPFEDPAKFGALVARIEGEIEALAQDRRNLARVRRNVLIICAIYVILALCAQDAVRSKLVSPMGTQQTEVAIHSVSPSSGAKHPSQPAVAAQSQVADAASSDL